MGGNCRKYLKEEVTSARERERVEKEPFGAFLLVDD